MKSFFEFCNIIENAKLNYNMIASFLQNRDFGPLSDYLQDHGYMITQDQIADAISNPSEGPPVANWADQAIRLMKDLKIN